MDYFLFNFSGVQFHYTMSLEKIIQIKNLIPEEFQKQKEKAQNQNIKNEEHKKAVQRQDKER